MANGIVIAQMTSNDEDQAKVLARGAVESKLAAGVQIDAPITAFYWWKSKVETAQEWRISYVTTTDRLPALEAWLHEQHPYNVPQWMTLPVTGGSEAYHMSAGTSAKSAGRRAAVRAVGWNGAGRAGSWRRRPDDRAVGARLGF